MKTKYLIMIAAAMLLTLASLATQAQDVYEYAMVTTGLSQSGLSAKGTKPMLFVSFSNGSYKEIEVPQEKAAPSLWANSSSALEYISTLSKEGWEVNDSGINAGSSYYFLLKRKVK